MIEREYRSTCANGHRDYVRVRGVVVDNDTVRLSDCPKCGAPRLADLLTEMENP